MVLAVVRSHYGTGYEFDREKVYRAGNALAEWLGFDSWVDIVVMQRADNREVFAKILARCAMTFQKFDAGENHRTKGETGDCQVRALVTVRGLTYDEAWLVLYRLQGELHRCAFPLVEALSSPEIQKRLGALRQLDFPAKKGKSRMTGNAFCKKYSKGRFILRMAHHVVAVKDGVLLDRFDSSSKCVYTAWEIQPYEKESVKETAVPLWGVWCSSNTASWGWWPWPDGTTIECWTSEDAEAEMGKLKKKFPKLLFEVRQRKEDTLHEHPSSL